MYFKLLEFFHKKVDIYTFFFTSEHNIVENQMYQQSNIPPRGIPTQPAAANHDRTVQQLIEPTIHIGDAGCS